MIKIILKENLPLNRLRESKGRKEQWHRRKAFEEITKARGYHGLALPGGQTQFQQMLDQFHSEISIGKQPTLHFEMTTKYENLILCNVYFILNGFTYDLYSNTRNSSGFMPILKKEFGSDVHSAFRELQDLGAPGYLLHMTLNTPVVFEEGESVPAYAISFSSLDGREITMAAVSEIPKTFNTIKQVYNQDDREEI